MTAAVAERAGATIVVPLAAVERAAEEYADFADEVSILCGIIVAGGGWWAESSQHVATTITCVGPAVSVAELTDLAAAFNAKWGQP